MSDVYAMGGEVVLALNIACFPPQLPPSSIIEILRGAGEKVRAAGGVIAGGHTVDDPEPKFGMSVMGVAHPDHITTKADARPGDVLLLTKPIGVGIITTVAKSDAAAPEHLEAAIASMLQLNRCGAQLASQFGLKAMTDITGFSLLGHASEMAGHSKVCLHIHSEQVPVLPGAREYAESWLFPGGSKRNADYFAQWVQAAPHVSEELLMLFYTPETSGGLLMAVPQLKLPGVEGLMRTAGQPYWRIGEVSAGAGIVVD
jgi:selenide,water dikinase